MESNPEFRADVEKKIREKIFPGQKFTPVEAVDTAGGKPAAKTGVKDGAEGGLF
jgi:hypothetical protein